MLIPTVSILPQEQEGTLEKPESEAFMIHRGTNSGAQTMKQMIPCGPVDMSCDI